MSQPVNHRSTLDAPPTRIPHAAPAVPDLAGGARLWLFLDYDGTLADFAPNPDVILPDAEVIELLSRLAAYPERLRLTVLSGRRLGHIERLVPVPGVLLAGTYGIELQTWQGQQLQLVDFERGRPFLDPLKQEWLALVEPYRGYYVEDKGYALALHGRRAEDRASLAQVFGQAKALAEALADRDLFSVQGGADFLEVAPLIADKGQSIETLLARFDWPGAGLIYLGDDDKDEPAFRVIARHGGQAVLVAAEPRPSYASARLEGPRAVRAWLGELANRLEQLDGVGANFP